MYSSPFIILLSNTIKNSDVAPSKGEILSLIMSSSVEIITEIDCKNTEEHQKVLTRFPDILSTWIVHEVNHVGATSDTCQMIELQGDGTHILYLVDNKLAEIFWYIPPLKKELPPFSYDIQSQEIQKLEDLFAFCGNTRKTFLNNHALLIEGYNCLKTSRRSSAGTKKGKIHSKDRRFKTSQLQIHFQPLEDYIVEGHLLY